MRGVKIVVVQSAVFHVLSEDGYKIQWLVEQIEHIGSFYFPPVPKNNVGKKNVVLRIGRTAIFSLTLF